MFVRIHFKDFKTPKNVFIDCDRCYLFFPIRMIMSRNMEYCVFQGCFSQTPFRDLVQSSFAQQKAFFDHCFMHRLLVFE